MLGVMLAVARIDDVLQGKVWAVEDTTRRASRRQKDLADIARLLEHDPALRSHVPPGVPSRSSCKSGVLAVAVTNDMDAARANLAKLG